MIEVIDGRTWRTPLTELPERTVGTARLARKNYRGTYYFEGVRGHEFYQTKGWLPVVALQQQNGPERARAAGPRKTWMVDDPLHWYGMGEAVDALPDGRGRRARAGADAPPHGPAAAVHGGRRRRAVGGRDRPRGADAAGGRAGADRVGRLLPRHPARAAGRLRRHPVGPGRRDAGDPRRVPLRAQVQCAERLPGVPLVQFRLRRTPRKEVVLA